MARQPPKIEPTRHALIDTDGTDKLTWFSVTEELTIHPGEQFNIVPGPQGKGWVLQILPKPAEAAV